MWSRGLAGLLPGFFLAVALTGLVCWLPPGPWQRALVPSLLAFVPLWVAAAIGAFAFRSGLRAWIGLSLAAAAGFALLWALKTLGWAQ
ncbi:hypothetical protein JR065_12575 [Xanthomonas sp. AmX2]|uniref:hypothetical protein n=1 Tax=Xanthomonas sp. TaxID=29446 RepID=UPI0019825327|nr:hypothetical protein [Xanthomonas sp.]MBN6151178.1 hypothetical protein [Xanthomonas sp.]